MCDRGVSTNQRQAKCNFRKRECPEQEECPVDKNTFVIERSNKKCSLRIEGQTILENEVVELSGPECCDCGDTIQIIGLNGVNVSVENNEVCVNVDELQQLLEESFCECFNGIGEGVPPYQQQNVLLYPYGLTLVEYVDKLRLFILNIKLTNCISDKIDDETDDEIKALIISIVEKHCESMALASLIATDGEDGYNDWCTGEPDMTLFFPSINEFKESINNLKK